MPQQSGDASRMSQHSSHSRRRARKAPAAAPAPMRTVILANPNSFRMAIGKHLAQVDRLARAGAMSLYPVQSPADIASALAEAAPGVDDRLVIIGGDGTLQAVVTELVAPAERGQAPTLCMLGGGRTNLTARDLGSHRRVLQRLEQLSTRPSEWHCSWRSVLRLGGSQHGPLYGFFVAGALVDAVIRDCHAYRARSRGWLRTGHGATPWRLSQLGLQALSGRSRFELPSLAVRADGLGSLSGPCRILLLSTLHHQGAGLSPYADRGQGPLRVTAIHQQAQAFWRHLPGLVAGRLAAGLGPQTGYLSGRSHRVQVLGLPSICLDGQEFALDPERPLQVEAGPDFRFLHP